jgi:hypothetical protein
VGRRKLVGEFELDYLGVGAPAREHAGHECQRGEWSYVLFHDALPRMVGLLPAKSCCALMKKLKV